LNSLLDLNNEVDPFPDSGSDSTIRPPRMTRVLWSARTPEMQDLHDRMADAVLSGQSPNIIIKDEDLIRLREE